MSLSVTVSGLRQYLDQVPLAEADEVRLAQLLAEAEQVVIDALAPVVYGAYGSAAPLVSPGPILGSPYLSLPPHQAGSVTAVVWLARYGDGDGAPETITDYAAADHGRLYRARWWYPHGHYRVTAVWGAGPAPASVRNVAYTLAVNLWRGRDQGFFQSSGAADGGGVRFTGGLPRELMGIIARARRDVLGVGV